MCIVLGVFVLRFVSIVQCSTHLLHVSCQRVYVCMFPFLHQCVELSDFKFSGDKSVNRVEI